MSGYVTCKTAKASNGIIRKGNLVRIPGEWTVATDTGTELRRDVQGFVGSITRQRPLRANRTSVEILDGGGCYLTDIDAKLLERI